MSKHTPGPWAIFSHPDPSCPAKSIGPIDGDFYGAHTTVYINHEANARLIAAAPELLEMCNRAELWLGTHPEGAEMQRAIRAVIAKAEDREP